MTPYQKKFLKSTDAPMDSAGSVVYDEKMSFWSASAEECPVCGTSGSTCTSGNQKRINIIGVDLFPSLGLPQTFVVEDDIWVDEKVSEFSAVRKLVHRAGSVISIPEASRLGLL